MSTSSPGPDLPRPFSAASPAASPAVSPAVPSAAPPGCPAHQAGPGVRGVRGGAHDGAVRLYGPAASADPMGTYERLRTQHGPIAPVLLEGDVPAWLVLGYDETLQVARNPRRFTRDSRLWRDWREGRVAEDSPVLPMLVWHPDCRSQDGREHQRLRGAVKESLERFDRRAVRRAIHRLAHLLVDDFAGAGHAELLSRFAQQLPMLVLTHLFGLPEEEGPGLVEASRQLVRGTERAIEADRLIQATLTRLVADKHASPGPDLASWLIDHEARLTDEEVRDHLRLVLVAANETTTNLMVNTLRMVLTDPRFRGTLNGGQMTLPAAVEQILWDEPPLMVCPARFPTYDVEIAGHQIREGDLLLLGLAAANADPAIRPFPGADMHGNRSHLSFGSGPHECPGQDIGRAITGSGIETLLSRLPDLRLAVPEEELSWTSSTWSRHLDALPVRFTPRHDRGHSPRPAAAAITDVPGASDVPDGTADGLVRTARPVASRTAPRSPARGRSGLWRLLRWPRRG
ncbi:cytochrome P450 [Streptomyces sp. TRM 70361]|uniref:cytochrome P450 n=1 Tax=Streptomyces sp. TRM 70361 TaxID=3116553 RepID=UPI002E7B41BD|nr:cytochrome P450 [Streptomyces sp. TRM 70361]MEE1939946.1 cytochrome P450 [Streptomyces sp. TRM 70361]